MLSDPIAIIGIGCRFPGHSNSPEAFWETLCQRKDTVRVLPNERFHLDTFYHPKQGVEGHSYSKWGALVDQFDGFDPGFFGISAREADFIDPQQRMILETSWRAIEDSRESFDPRQGRSIGVFTGVSTFDYHLMQSGLDSGSKTDIYMATGSVHSIVANRVSYIFNLRGPSVAVDTACSSALVAVHMACQSLLRGDCEMALAGGVNAILGPEPYIAFCKMGMLSPTGRCKPFDSRADGFARGEGAGMVLLKPLARAIADGNRIYATIAATASNQDGRTNGITVPSPLSQELLTREALRRAGIPGAKIAYMEAHGTGTPIGDPIEAHALGMALGDGRKGVCPIGSVKGNIGHLEAGAGAAGLIKAALCLYHRRVPPSLHFKKPNPNIDFEKLKIRVVTEDEELPDGKELPYVGVNSFGFGGANAQAVLQAVPKEKSTFRRIARPAASAPGIQGFLLPLSSGASEALPALAKQARGLLAAAPAKAADLCLSLATQRLPFSHRTVACGRDAKELLEALDVLAGGGSDPKVVEGQPMDLHHPGPVFVFSGQGPQWYAMGRDLLEHEPVFRDVLERCDAVMKPLGGWSLLEELGKSEQDSRINETAFAQPAIFAIQAGLFELWKSRGIEPAAVVGHSVGEVAAAYAAGILTLDEASRVIFWRGACMDATPERGKMLAASLTADEALSEIAPYAGKVHLGAVNGPKSVTLSGDGEPLEKVAAALAARGVFHRFLKVNYAFHSHHMEPARRELLEKLGKVKRGKAGLTIFSTVSGGPAREDDFDANYWWSNVREPVYFAQAIDGLIDSGFRLFLELAPHPVLSPSVGECLTSKQIHGETVHSLERKQDERLSMLRALGRLHTLGQQVDWQRLYPSADASLDLPEMPFHRAKHWHEPVMHQEMRSGGPAHPLLVRRMPSAHPTWSTRLDLDVFPFIREHVIQDHPVFPAAGYLEIATAAARLVHGADKKVIVEDVDFSKAMFLPEGADPTTLQFRYRPADAGFEIATRTGEHVSDNTDWTINVKGRLRPDVLAVPDHGFDAAAIIKRCDHLVEGELFYRTCDYVGLRYSGAFRGIKAIHTRPMEALAEIEMAPGSEVLQETYHISPALLDQCFQALTSAVPPDFTIIHEMGFMPVRCGSFRLFRKAEGNRFHCHIQLSHCGGKMFRGDIELQDSQGRLIMRITGMESQAVVRTKEYRATSGDECLYQNLWVEAPLGGSIEVACELPAPQWPQVDTDARRRVRAIHRDFNAAASAYLAAAKFPKSQPAALRQAITTLRADLKPGRRAPDFAKLLALHPEAYPEAICLDRVGQRLSDLAAGRVTLDEILSPAANHGLEEHLAQDAAIFRADHQRLRAAITSVLAQIPENARIDVLVAGAGTGGAVADLLDAFDPARTRLIYLEANEKRAAMAEQKFFDHHFIEFRQGSVNQRGKSAAIKPGESFDLALLFGPATADALGDAKHFHTFLKPRALCLFEHRVEAPAWMRLTFGLDPASRNGVLDATADSIDAIHARLAAAGFGEISSDAKSDSGRVITSAREPQKTVRAAAAKLSLTALRHQPSTVWIVFADHGGQLDPLIEILASRPKDRVVRIVRGKSSRRIDAHTYQLVPGHIGATKKLVDELEQRFSLDRTRFVFGWSLDSATPLSADALLDFESRSTSPLLALGRAMPPTADALPQAFYFLTRGAQPVREGGKAIDPAQMLVVGLGRSFLSENPRIRTRLIDLDPAMPAGEAELLAADLQSSATDDEVAHRQLKRLSLRFTHVPLVRGGASRKSGHRLDVLVPGMLDSMTFVESPRPKPGKGMVEIEVRAAALNFRDVMKSLGIYPSDNALDMLIGDECAGVIERIGPGVKGWKVGDRVMTLGVGCFGSHITAAADLLLPVPDGITFEEASTLPVAFMTAVYSLCEIARLRAGETVLVQAGSGGVGLAAIQVARAMGAEVIATAGSREKRDFLHGLGVQHVFDSRSLAFAEQVREVTGGRGVDVVLNSLAGLAIEKGLESLAPYGRFVEIGKRDIYGNTPVGLRPFRHNLTLSVVDLGAAMNGGGEMLRRLLQQVLAMFEGKGLRPLPHRVFPMARAKDAFRCMAAARHIGKIVLSSQGPSITPKPAPREAKHLADPKGAYIVTGGLTGFGAQIGLWLLGQGVRHLHLVSRSGKADEKLRAGIAEAAKRGYHITVSACDVTSRASVDALLKRIRKSGTPIRGIIHSAMVLDDKTLANMTPEQMTRVLAPKVRGAWNLHEATLDDPIDMFVLFSSVSSILGNAGQANYAAANAFLDALAHYRHARKLPALTVNWGQLGDVGVAASDDKLKETLTRQGILPLPVGRAAELLGDLLANGHVQTGVIPIDWKAFRATHPQLVKSSRYESVFASIHEDGADPGARSARDVLLEAPAAKRRALAIQMLREEVAKVLRSSPAKIREDRPLTQLGLDSLMTFELLMRLENLFEISMPPTRMKEGTTLADVATHLLELIGGAASGSTQAGETASPDIDPAAAKAEATDDSLPAACLIDLKKSGSRPPLFMIHPAGGLVGGYDAIAAALPDDLPAIGIQSRMLAGAASEYQSFDRMADAYTQAILKRQPAGDIHLFGFSFGSWLAHAIASRIEDAGRKVAWLGLVDPMEAVLAHSGKKDDHIISWHTGNITVLILEFLDQLGALTPAIARELHPLAMELMALDESKAKRRLTTWLDQHGLIDAGVDPRLITFLVTLQITHSDMGRKAKLKPVSAPVVCWRGGHEWAAPHASMKLTEGPLREITRSCEHFEFFAVPHVTELAAEVASAVDSPV